MCFIRGSKYRWYSFLPNIPFWPSWKHQKTSYSYALIRTPMCVYQGLRVFFWCFQEVQKETSVKKKALIAATADILFFSLSPFDLPENIRKPLEWKGLTSSTCNRGSLMLWCNAIKPIQNQNSGRTLILVSSISIYKILEMT